MPMTASMRSPSMAAQKPTPASISDSSSSRGMYGSCQRSTGITPRYASAASLLTANTWSTSASVHLRIMGLGVGLSVLGQLWQRHLARDHPREPAPLHELAPLAAAAGHLVLCGADRLLAAARGLHRHQIAIASRRHGADHPV